MTSKILKALSLRVADSASIELLLNDGHGEERQPPPRKFVVSDERHSAYHSPDQPSAQTLAVWTGQEPGERIANTILLCAIRDRAWQVTLEPEAAGVSVRFQIESGVREQKLPTFALAPIVRHFKALTSARQAPPENENFELSGAAYIAVDEQFYQVQFSPLANQWGKGVEVRLSPQK